jgi:tetratricopeptide (TPR) repeat protein
MRSLAYTGLSNFQEAINDIDKAIELKPKEPLYYNKRGTYCQFFYIFKTLATKSETELKKLDQLYDACLDDFRIAARLGHKESQEYLKSYGKKW